MAKGNKSDYLWESMFAIGDPKKKRLDFRTITPEEFLEFYIKRQSSRKKGSKYVEIVKKDTGRALGIAQEVVMRRRAEIIGEKTKPRSKKEFMSQSKKAGTSPKTEKKETKTGSQSDLGLFENVNDLPKIYVDAGTKNNGMTGLQETTIAGILEDGTLAFEEFIGDKTNNEGEITAVIRALEQTKEPVCILSDSKIAVGWAKKGKTKNAPNREALAKEANRLLIKTSSAIEWLPRDENKAGIYLEVNYNI